jgi:stage V sporulation protein AB
MRCVRLYERAVFGGALLGSITDIVPAMQLPVLVTCVVGLVTGLFTGLFTAALAEVLNVLPVFGRRFNIERSITVLVVALAAGKALGSLVYWLLPQLQP